MKRTLSLVLILSLLFSLMLCIIPSAEDEVVAGPTPEITHANVVFGNSVHLLIAVSYADVYADAETAAENIYITVDGERINSYGAAPYAIGGIAFKYTSIAAKEMGDELEIKAYDNGVEVDSTTYSILEYAIKAKSTDASNTLLVTAIDAMMAYGKEAQAAFSYEGDYNLANFDQYGLIAVGGAKQSKYIALADSVVTPEAIDASVPYLYDMEFDKVAGNSVTVKAGYNRYFFYDDAVYATTANPYGFDMDLPAHDAASLYLTQNKARTTTYLRTFLNNGVPQIRIKGYEVSAFSISMAATTSDESIVQVQEGYWAAKTMPDAAGNAGTAMIMANTLFQANKYLDEDGVFTVCLSLAKIEGTPIANGPSFRISGGKSGVTSNAFWRFFANGTDTGATILSQSKGAPLVTLNEVSNADFKAGNVDKEDFTTFYLVFNTKANKVTVYTADGNTKTATTAPVPTPAKDAFSSLYDYLMDSNCYFDWTFAIGSGLIVNKMILTPGNIFN